MRSWRGYVPSVETVDLEHRGARVLKVQYFALRTVGAHDRGIRDRGPLHHEARRGRAEHADLDRNVASGDVLPLLSSMAFGSKASTRTVGGRFTIFASSFTVRSLVEESGTWRLRSSACRSSSAAVGPRKKRRTWWRPLIDEHPIGAVAARELHHDARRDRPLRVLARFVERANRGGGRTRG